LDFFFVAVPSIILGLPFGNLHKLIKGISKGKAIHNRGSKNQLKFGPFAKLLRHKIGKAKALKKIGI